MVINSTNIHKTNSRISPPDIEHIKAMIYDVNPNHELGQAHNVCCFLINLCTQYQLPPRYNFCHINSNIENARMKISSTFL